MTTTEELVPLLRRAKVLPVVRAADPERADVIVDDLADAGLQVVELTTTIPDWSGVLRRLSHRHPHLIAGMGTILDARAAETAFDMGAAFLVTPLPVPAAYEIADRTGVAVIGGGFTPAELQTASSRGIAKLFPAHVGGPDYLRSLLAVLPDAHVVPTGGIRTDAVEDWLGAGALAVGIGRGVLRRPRRQGAGRCTP